MKKIIFVLYGSVAYVVFLATFLYTIGFVSNLMVPKSIDSGDKGELVGSIAIDVVLLALFAIQHTIMARPAFKSWWTRFVPEPIERSTFVLIASLLLALMMWQWRPLPDVVWGLTGTVSYALWALFALGWLTVLVSTYLIDHFDLFGLRQVTLYARGREYAQPQFVERALYKYTRHPLMLGFTIAFWATPQMSVGHLLFAVVTTGYIFFGIWIEEQDLLKAHGEDYASYRRRVSRLIPLPPRTTPDPSS